MHFKKPKHYKGLNHSGPNMVLPPTFPGIKAIVQKYGEVTAESMFPQSSPDASNDLSSAKSLVEELVVELQSLDKVERTDLIRDFNSMVRDLSSPSKPKKPAAPAPGAGAEPEPGAGASAQAPAQASAQAPVPGAAEPPML